MSGILIKAIVHRRLATIDALDSVDVVALFAVTQNAQDYAQSMRDGWLYEVTDLMGNTISEFVDGEPQ